MDMHCARDRWSKARIDDLQIAWPRRWKQPAGAALGGAPGPARKPEIRLHTGIGEVGIDEGEVPQIVDQIGLGELVVQKL